MPRSTSLWGLLRPLAGPALLQAGLRLRREERWSHLDQGRLEDRIKRIDGLEHVKPDDTYEVNIV